MLSNEQSKVSNEESGLTPFTCRCGLLLGLTDGKIIMIASLIFTRFEAKCPACKRWTYWRQPAQKVGNCKQVLT